jgi:hypothetical protein
VKASGADIEAEIGYDKNRYQGSPRQHPRVRVPDRRAPRYGAAALQENTADFVHGLEKRLGTR